MSVIVFGSCNADLVMRVESLPTPGETVAALSYEQLPGGKGANQAAAASAFGVPTKMLGAVGKDSQGDMLASNLRGFGVDVSGLSRMDTATGIACVTVENTGENQIVIHSGANGLLRFDPQMIPNVPDAGDTGNPQVYLAQLEVPLDDVVAFLAHGRTHGALTVLNTAPAVPEAVSAFPLCDIMVMNQSELAAYAGRPVPQDHGEISRIAAQLLTREDQWAVVTLGGDGALAIGSETLHIPARITRVVDTTGAGDTFCGVLAACLQERRSLADAMRIASLAGSLAVEREGAAASTPRREEILALFRD